MIDVSITILLVSMNKKSFFNVNLIESSADFETR